MSVFFFFLIHTSLIWNLHAITITCVFCYPCHNCHALVVYAEEFPTQHDRSNDGFFVTSCTRVKCGAIVADDIDDDAIHLDIYWIVLADYFI